MDNEVLKNKVIITTSPEDKAGKIVTLLEEAGAQVFNMPVFSIKRNEPDAHITNIIHNINTYQWLFFTSGNGVEAFFELIKPLQIQELPRIVTYGENAALKLREYGKESFLCIKAKTSCHFFDEIKNMDVFEKAHRALLIQGNLASSFLHSEMNEIMNVTRITLYENIMLHSNDSSLLERIREGRYDMILFASPSAFNNLICMLGNEVTQDIKAASIGAVTGRAMNEKGVCPLVQPDNPSVENLVAAVKNFFEKKK